ncbi:MAG: HAD hydrolase family protein [Lachnospiraceae bacterium]|nr:HAD hydrolase family protein [Muribaculaceae bacterium]MCM1411373.1 HAD hydrolase family protein [Lachnospiraceae bacterium]
MIKFLVIDVDGTLTDGKVYIGNDGELCKAFYVRDGIGIKAVIRNGIIPVILTSRESEIVIRRCEELGIDHIYQGAEDKKTALTEIMDTLSISPDELAYIADDINDLESMKLAGVRACPNDASPEIRRISDFVCFSNGGEGAVREFCEYILQQNIEGGDHE